MLQLYRLYVVQAENRKLNRQRMRKLTAAKHHRHRRHRQYASDDIYTITKGRNERLRNR